MRLFLLSPCSAIQWGCSQVLKGSSSISVMNLFIANMAVADLMLTCTVMPVQVDFTHGDVLGFREYWES